MKEDRTGRRALQYHDRGCGDLSARPPPEEGFPLRSAQPFILVSPPAIAYVSTYRPKTGAASRKSCATGTYSENRATGSLRNTRFPAIRLIDSANDP